jgi:hypothetical protein
VVGSRGGGVGRRGAGMSWGGGRIRRMEGADEAERGRTAATVQCILLRREGNHGPYVDMGYTPRIASRMARQGP